MATATWFRVQARGRFVSGVWLGEEAQMGFSLCVPTGGDFGDGIDDALLECEVTEGGGAETVADLGRIEYGSHGADTAAFSKAHQVAICQRFKTYATNFASYWSNLFKWEELRLSAITAAGDVVNGASVMAYNPTINGSDTSSDFPPQNAIVQSLTTGGRGPRNRGRWYVPAHSNVMSAQGVIGSTPATNLNAAAKVLKDGIEADCTFTTPLAGGLKLAVVSAAHQTASEILTFRVGNHFDTQRRRAQQVLETYTELPAN